MGLGNKIQNLASADENRENLKALRNKKHYFQMNNSKTDD